MRGNIDPTQQRITLEQGDLGTKELRQLARRGRHASRCPASSTTAPSRGLRSGSPASRCRSRRSSGCGRSFVAPKVRDWVVATYRQRQRRAARDRDQCAAGGAAAPAVRRCRRTACRSTSSAAAPRCARSTACRRSAMPTSTSASPGAPRPSRSARASSKFRRGAGSRSPTACSKCPNTHPKTPPARVQLPRRRAGAGGGRTAGARTACANSPARRSIRPPAAATIDGAGPARHAAAPRSAAGRDRLRHHGRSHELQRRQDAVRPEGRGADAAGHRQQPGLPDQGRRQDRRARRRRSNTASSRARPTPRSGCRPRSTRPRGARLGLDVGPALAGPMPVKLDRPRRPDDKDGRFNVEADLTPAKIDNLLPGWVKAAGPAGARDLHAGQAEGQAIALRRSR